MALSQIQIIQSLGEALSWYEKELDWGAQPPALRHITGRIGELYAAMITRGQMAPDTNQQGYDVISADNERISVKTVTTGNHVKLNGRTINHVDRVMILRLNNDKDEGISIETILDCDIDKYKSVSTYSQRKNEYYIGMPAENSPVRPVEDLEISSEVTFENYRIRQYENGTIKVFIDDNIQSTARKYLQEISSKIGIEIVNSNGNTKNTRSLGADIIKTLKARNNF